MALRDAELPPQYIELVSTFSPGFHPFYHVSLWCNISPTITLSQEGENWGYIQAPG
jgi:hypothetical protein